MCTNSGTQLTRLDPFRQFGLNSGGQNVFYVGIAPREIHELGTVQQLKIGSTTGMTPPALEDIILFLEEEIRERTGKEIKIPVNKSICSSRSYR